MAQGKAIKANKANKANKTKASDELPTMISILATPDVSGIRTAEFAGDEYTVVPVVMLVEGVLWPGNSTGPELALAEEFGRFPEAWDGRPVVLDHPKLQGTPVSANSPGILEDYSFGKIFNTKLDDKKLKAEIWIDNARVAELGEDFEDAVRRLTEGDEVVEVSTGLFSLLENSPGVYEGQEFDRVWRNIVPDHLAVLPEGIKGACSVEGGCGAPRVNSADPNPDPDHFTCARFPMAVPATTDTVIVNTGCDCEDPSNCQCAPTPEQKESIFKGLRGALETLGGIFKFRDNQDALSDEDIRTAIGQALRTQTNYFWIVAVYNGGNNQGEVVYEDFEEGKLFSTNFQIEDGGKISLSSERTQVRPETRFVPVDVGGDEPSVNSDSDSEVPIVNKEEIVQSLIANEATKFDENDREWLMSLEEGQLEKLLSPEEESDPPSAAASGEDEDPASVVEDPAAQPAVQSVEQYVEGAPEEIREVLNTGLRMQRERKDALVKGLLANERNKFSEESLRKRSIEELENLASLADVPDDFSAGAPLHANSAEDDDTRIPAPPRLFPSETTH